MNENHQISVMLEREEGQGGKRGKGGQERKGGGGGFCELTMMEERGEA